MKRLIVRSESAKEDEQVAAMISNDMMDNKVDEIVWYSNMGAKVAQMERAVARMEKLEKSVAAIAGFHFSVSSKLSNLKFGLADALASIKELQERADELERPIKKQRKKKGEDEKVIITVT